MAKQIILIFCEGPHDVAFISRVLKVIGLKSNDSMKLGDYPSPLKQLLEKEAVKSDVAGLNLSEIRNNLLPSKTFSINESLVFLYSLGGDTKKVSRKDLFGKFNSLIASDNEIAKERFTSETKLSVLYLFDADDKGVSVRLEEVNEEIIEFLNEINQLEGEIVYNLEEKLFEKNAEIKNVSKLQLGSFIFTGENEETGKLEEILIPLMKEGNNEIFDKAENFLKDHFDEERLFRLKVILENDLLIEKRSTRGSDKAKYDEKKSIIGTVGQLQRSGASNIVCIDFSDFLTLEKINSNPQCLKIISFFREIID